MDFLNLSIKINNDLIWRVLFFLCGVCIIVGASDAAFAADTANDVVGQALCRLVENLSGGIARGIATMAIFAVGVGLFLGNVKWSVAALTAAGVGIIFSAQRLVAFLSGDSDASNCDSGT